MIAAALVIVVLIVLGHEVDPNAALIAVMVGAVSDRLYSVVKALDEK